ncbi:50S ribosomal protein L11 methyltransferase [Brevibacillus ruminantium]|uniref:Ribosomal protein L11 methyltransferase n=1 Tax=Brevibacillus ruminantium TaxID=2950604 RepID=A0ABY4WDP3_9BACL|nr:50S ribosomal protein L11 methyltransferase [Brevibacillus ruminantium]USG64253.1 50S ribosomal protein L11 methyltransferase [Brevibacillus ruminantium]
MELTWLKYTLLVDRKIEDLFVGELLDSPYTLGWVEPQIEILTTENGYDYAENTEGPVIVYLFEKIEDSEEEHVARLHSYISHWADAVSVNQVERVAEEHDSWQEEFREVRIGEWWIAPSWTTTEEVLAAQNVLWIDPGAAFGTGYHGTTQDILKLLQERSPAGKRVMDIGAGSGILSLFCVKSGAAKPVWAVDINPQSDYQIRVNGANNHVDEQDVEILIGDAAEPSLQAELPEQVDLILVNIGGDEDVEMLPVVEERLVQGGQVILSGIVTWNRDHVVDAYQQAGFSLITERASEEWVTILMEKA